MLGRENEGHWKRLLHQQVPDELGLWDGDMCGMVPLGTSVSVNMCVFLCTVHISTRLIRKTVVLLPLLQV